MDWTVDALTAETLLTQYSEWLDTSGTIDAPLYASDHRTHEDLVREFVTQRNTQARPKIVGV